MHCESCQSRHSDAIKQGNNSKQLAPSSKVIIAIIFPISVGESFRVAEKLAIAGCMINGDGPGMPDL